MSKQPLTIAKKLSDELTSLPYYTLLSPFQTQRYLRECDRAMSVDASYGWMLKAIVYGFSDNPEQMKTAYENALRLSPNNQTIIGNFVSSISNYGYFEDALEIISKKQVSKETLNAANINLVFEREVARNAIGLVDLDRMHTSDVKNIENIQSRYDVSLDSLKAVIGIANSALRKHSKRFGIYPTEHWDFEDGVFSIFYSVIANETDTQNILSDYDSEIYKQGLSELSHTANVCIIPFPSDVEISKNLIV